MAWPGLAWIGAGVVALGLYGFVATLQPDPHFGRILAAYGGVFVAGSLAWGMLLDGFRPDRFDVTGALICLVGGRDHVCAEKRRLTGSRWVSSVPERNKAVVRRLVEEVINAGRLEVLDELYSPAMAAAARRWITPFREAFPDVAMTVVDLVAEGDKVAARFTCSATQQNEWLGQPATGARFERVDEVYFFRFRDGRIVHAWGLEDNLDRMRQLGHLPNPTTEASDDET